MSNSKFTLEENDLLKLTCSFCKKHLSVPPIFTSEDVKTYKCGRCQFVTSNTPMQQNKLYEITAKYFLFPCSESTNCKKVLAWEEVQQHETKCLHRTISCPHSNCSERFEIMGIEKHFENSHPFNIQQQPNFVDYILKIKGENIYLMTNNGNTFLYCRSTDNENIYFTVYTLSSCTHNTFSVAFVSLTGSVKYTKGCSFSPYYEGYFTTRSLTVNKELLIGILNDDSVCQKVELKINTEDLKCSIPAKILLERQFEQALQSNFKCCVCRKMLEYKTKVCRNGHSFCESHKRGCSDGGRGHLYYNSDTTVDNFAYDSVYELCRAHLPAMSETETSAKETVKKSEPRVNFEELKCSFCDKYLSIGPIFTSFDGKVNKCGRCTFVILDLEKERPLQRSNIYEKLAKQMQFPCSESPNCKEVLEWEEAGNHESLCPYKQIRCPHLNCYQKVELHTILNHFQRFHTNNFSNNVPEIKLDFKIDKPDVILINLEGKLFIAYYNIKGENISFSIQALSPFGRQCEFSISCSSQTSQINLNKSCSIPIFDGISSDKYEILINTSLLKQCLGLTQTLTSSFKVHIRICPYSTEFARSFCKALECPVCFKVMNSTVNLCSTGHSVCQNCMTQIQTCPICRSSFSRLHNIPLEHIYSLFHQYFPDIFNPNDLDC